MKRRLTKILTGLAALTAFALGGAAIANATGVTGGATTVRRSPPPRPPVPEPPHCVATGGGTVQASERDNEKGATFEVEVRKPDGSVVDVRLDSSYGLVAVDDDQETNDDNGGQNEDAGEN